jgi:hypothetical protein|nr:hypothetical protein Q903MT_gene5332 [Picea sitchensis]
MLANWPLNRITMGPLKDAHSPMAERNNKELMHIAQRLERCPYMLNIN